MKKYVIEEGVKIHRLTILKLFLDDKENPTLKGSTALCVCDCGTEKTIPLTYLRQGKIKSCGCAVGRNPLLSPAKREARDRRKARKRFRDQIAEGKRDLDGRKLESTRQKVPAKIITPKQQLESSRGVNMLRELAGLNKKTSESN